MGRVSAFNVYVMITVQSVDPLAKSNSTFFPQIT